MQLVIAVSSGVGAAVVGGAIGIPLLLRQKKKWDRMLADNEAQNKDVDVGVMMPSTRQKSASETSGSGLPHWMRTVEIAKDDHRCVCVRCRDFLCVFLFSRLFPVRFMTRVRAPPNRPRQHHTHTPKKTTTTTRTTYSTTTAKKTASSRTSTVSKTWRLAA